jgi:UDPglucose 6-dehydrogenase
LRISVIGVGKLGLTMAAVYAEAGHNVLCVDSNKEHIDNLSKGICTIQETGLNELFQKHKAMMEFSSDYSKVKDTSISFIIVPTPSKKDGSFTNSYVLSVFEGICESIKGSSEYHLIVIVSTVMPGSCVDVFIPKIEKLTDKKLGQHWGMCYGPEFIALGEVIRGMKYPDTLLVGESDTKAGDILESFHRMTLNPMPPIHRMSLWNAEIAKLALNCAVTMKISYANMIAELCEQVPTGNAYDVLSMVGEDKRIGKKYLNPGLGFSGPCFPRDNRAFQLMASRNNSVCMLSSATQAINDRHNDRYAQKAKQILGSGNHKVAILGISYKPYTGITEESAALKIIKELTVGGECRCDIRVYDPMTKYEGVGKQVGIVEEALKEADLAIICTLWPEFRNISANTFKTLMAKPNVLDCWGIYDIIKMKGIKLYTLGVNDGRME